MNRILPLACYSALLCTLVLQGWPSSAQSQDASANGGASTKFRLIGDSIPAPPRQTAAWKAPETKLSEEFVSATAALFRQGLADPRGCEYREIEVVVGGFEPPWSDTILKTHGWVLPEAGKQTQRFGVCWDGLVYPLVSIGNPADVRGDASAAAVAEVEGAIYGTGRYWHAYFEDFCLCHPWAGRSVSHLSPLPVKSCLLLRLGEVELAEKVWNRWTSELASYPTQEQFGRSTGESVEANKPYLKDPYLILTNLWTLSLFDRAVAGHMRGDDQLSLASAKMLATVWPAVEAEAAQRGFSRPPPEKIEQGAPYFLLDARRAEELLADQQRRAEDRRRGNAPPVLCGDYADPEPFSLALAKELNRCPDKSHRIALLIRELEEESPATCVNPPAGYGCRSGSGNTLVAFLVNEGEESVEPLLACLESDARLTHFISCEERYPLPVHLFAEMALEEVLKMPFRTSYPWTEEAKVDEQKRRQVQAKKIRAYWIRYKGVPMAERWYRILADDEAEPTHWLAAARAILQPISIPVTRETMTLGWDYCWRRTNGNRRLHGDVLRNRTGPSVTELMAGRIESLYTTYAKSLGRGVRLEELQEKLVALEEQLGKLGDRQDKANSQEYNELEKKIGELEIKRDELTEQHDDLNALQSGCDMALCLARWDPAAALPYLRRLTAICRKTESVPNANSLPDCIDRLIPMVLARAAAGDFTGLDEYADLVRKAQPHWLSNGYDCRGIFIFEPLCRYPDHPAVVKMAEWLFDDKASPWYPILISDERQKEPSIHKLSSPLVTMPAFRKRVLQLLENRREIGDVSVVSNEKIVLGVARSRETSTFPNDPLCPPPGTKAAFRVCDVCAYELSSLEGMPKCELFWPEKERDRAVAACAAMLRQYGDRFRMADKIVDGDGFPLRLLPPTLTFPMRDRPATPDEVRKGEAIFSLMGQGNVRVSKMPKLPRRARWTTLKDYPISQIARGESGKPGKSIGYEQTGIIWQAEEVEIGGRWQRYYGFVGRFGIAKAAAEEIEFLQDPEESIILADHLLIRLRPAPGAEEKGCVRLFKDSEYFPSIFFYHTDQPMVFNVEACNRSGADRRLPPIAESAPGRMPDNGIPISLLLRYCPEIPAFGYVPGWDDYVPICSLVGMSWTEVPRKTNEQLNGCQVEKQLMPTECVNCFQLDLKRLFDVGRPGTYRLALKSADGRNGAWQQKEIVFSVTEKSGNRRK